MRCWLLTAVAACLLVTLLPGCRGGSGSAELPAARAGDVEFVDVTQAAGVNFKHLHGGIGKKYFLETSGAGVCFFDYDNDGRPDLYLVQSGTLPNQPGFGGASNRSVLYHNEGDGRFVDVTDKAGVGNFRYGQGCCVGDFDNDGWLDLYVTNFGANRLYHNNHDGTFTDVAEKAGVACAGYNTGCSFADVDGDGHLDLYVARYATYKIGSDPPCSLASGLHSYCPPSAFDGAPNVFLKNNGDGTFKDVTAATDTADPHGRGLGVMFFDYNDDGKPDLFVANDGTPNRLYKNLGDLHFREIGGMAGVSLNENGTAAAGMGIDAADYDGDGRLDLFVADFTGEPNELFRNFGEDLFENTSAAAGTATPSLPYTKFGAAFMDYDMDGLPDIIIANGHVADDIAKASPGITYAEPKSLYRNLGTRAFEDVSRQVGAAFMRPEVSRGLALADMDGDGDQDVVVNNNNHAATLFRNDSRHRHHWVQLRFHAATGDPFAIGAKIVVEAGGRKQTREVRSGSSYLSQNDLTQVFGLGNTARIDRVQVRWPGRGTQEWTGLAVDKLHLLEEGRR